VGQQAVLVGVAKDTSRDGNGFKAQCLIEPCSLWQQKSNKGRTCAEWGLAGRERLTTKIFCHFSFL